MSFTPNPEESDLVHMQRIAAETVQYLRELQMQITTGKIERGVMEALRRSGVITKMDKHDRKLNRIETAFRRGLNHILKGIDSEE